MRLRLIMAKNVGVYENLHLDVSNLTLTSIIGKVSGQEGKSNSSGKTTIFRTIYYGLVGRDYSGETVDSLMREGADSMEVLLELEMAGRVYTIKRGRTLTSSTAELLEDYELLCSGTRNVNNSLTEILRMSPDVLGTTLFFIQNQHGSFTNETPANRKAFLSSILSLEEWTKFHKYSKERLSEKNKQISSLDSELGFLEKNKNKNTNFDERTEQAKKEIVKWEETFKRNQLIVDEIVRKIKDFETMKSQKEIHTKAMASVYEAATRASKMDEEARRAKFDYDIARDRFETAKKRREAFRAENRTTGETYTAKLSRLQLANERLSVEHEMLEHIVGALNVMHDSSDKERAACPLCKRSIIHGEDLLTSNSVRLMSTKKEIEDNKAGIEKARQLLDENAKLERAEAKYESESNVFFVKMSSAAELFRQAQDTLTRARENSATFAQMMTNSDMTDADYAQAKRQRDEMRQFSDRDQAKLTSARVLQVNIDMERRVYEETLKKILEIEKNKVDLQKEVEYTSVVARMFSNTNEGIPMCIIDEAVEKIQSEANEFLKEYEAPFFIQLDTTKYTKDGEARDTLDINILTHAGEKRPYNVLCGAEKAQVDIALRFSLSMLLCDRYDVSFESLYIDEALSAFDEYNKEITLKIFKVLAKRFSQIFVISHDSSIRDVLPQSIVVNRKGDKSEVEVFE